MALTLIVVLLLVLATGIPIGIGLGIIGLGVAVLLDGPHALSMLGPTLYAANNSFLITAIPLFVLMSEILRRAGVTEILFEAVTRWVGHLPGGLGVSTVVTSAIGASITGSSIANAASMAMVAMKPMLDRGYDRRLTFGLIAASGTLGILIPPSIPLLLYGAITDQSVGKLFTAGLVPGIVLTVMLIAYVVVRAITDSKYIPLPKASWADRWAQTRYASGALVLPVIVIGGIYFGIFTATEAAGIGVLYSLILTLLIYRTLKLRDLFSVFMDSMTTSCMILFLVSCSVILGHAVTTLQISQSLMSIIESFDLSATMFVLAVMVMLVILGCILEVISVIYIVVPILYPAMVALDIDPIWFGILFVINMEIALVTPPVGMVLYVVTGIAKRPISEVISGVMPFIALLFLFLGLMIAFPAIVMTLPESIR
ncbi:TRAP transporter large permease [Xanthobacter tagetidis]|uniref:TRAP transporter large permease protein n=1 Tax=Xanthobacter tagetidis TaxID=60216 RepID=A0A3L7ACT6_9HYPH|nr:TRAP transporter large permease [Xanthobacter tagetidis]MBB6309799.1 C4-dicarboxylate transporter DctM subunit [Xanthobacter tagetidis]RLP78173.1 TRAP transporter large permease [Xanthobacter tagetidis]